MALLQEFSKFLVTDTHTHGPISTPAQARGNKACGNVHSYKREKTFHKMEKRGYRDP